MLYKLIAPSLFPQYDKIIISDVDVCFLGNIAPSFFDFDVNEEYLLGGVVSNNPDAFFPLPAEGWRSGYKRFNNKELKALQHGAGGGYLIINLKQWRKQNTQNRAMAYLKNNAQKLVLAEQDVLNIICFPKIKKISLAHLVSHASWDDSTNLWGLIKPNIYTQEEIYEARDTPIQIHYVGANKPWNTPDVPKADLWFCYLCKTPFLHDYLQNLESLMFQKFKQKTLSCKIMHFVKRNPFFLFKPQTYFNFFNKITQKS